MPATVHSSNTVDNASPHRNTSRLVSAPVDSTMILERSGPICAPAFAVPGRREGSCYVYAAGFRCGHSRGRRDTLIKLGRRRPPAQFGLMGGVLMMGGPAIRTDNNTRSGCPSRHQPVGGLRRQRLRTQPPPLNPTVRDMKCLYRVTRCLDPPAEASHDGQWGGSASGQRVRDHLQRWPDRIGVAARLGVTHESCGARSGCSCRDLSTRLGRRRRPGPASVAWLRRLGIGRAGPRRFPRPVFLVGRWHDPWIAGNRRDTFHESAAAWTTSRSRSRIGPN